ncbi:MAG: hypothetical protein JSU85_07715 [Candidatus Zixiibacteriota bacterium]|nr:MAG: hypothetical protein JSU85_07715 [candidate division Zixibacteria bacterium]
MAGSLCDVSIYSKKVLFTGMNYIKINPVKAGLVDGAENYLYFSFYKYGVRSYF